ncbi:MAG: C4-dicarboxylate ABC transporter substrate-binding protein [Paracoccaceae bacterium]|nr:C4-dicarboxylate ABC transporter substrate-binding protein [Paracoccaceae bacterium]
MSKTKALTATIAALGITTGAFAQVNLTAETASPVSVPGQTVLSLAEVAKSADTANIQVTTGQTLTNSVQNVAEGKTDIAAAPFLLTFLLSNGAGPYASLGKENGANLASDLAVLYTYRFGTYGLSAYSSRNFGGWDAVDGATIYNGPPRGAALNRARALVKLVTGLDDSEGYSGIQVNWGQAVKTITDGTADAHVLPMNFPDGRLGQAAASGEITIFSMPSDAYNSEASQKYRKAPGSVGVVAPSEGLFGPNTVVVSEDDMFRGIGEVGGEIVNVSMDEEIAYSLTKAFIDGMEVFTGKGPMMPTVWLGETDVVLTGMCGAIPVKYHPGAVRAWEEAGHLLPDCAKP